MKFWKVAAGVLAAAAILPYQVIVTKENEEDAVSTVTVKSLLYTLEVAPKKDENGVITEEKDVNINIPSEIVNRGISFVSNKVAEVVALCKEKACHREADEEEEITIEIPAEEIEEAPAEA